LLRLGHVDFIFGAATAFFEKCDILVRRNGYVTAASTPRRSRTASSSRAARSAAKLPR